jgi:hypothetical protein
VGLTNLDIRALAFAPEPAVLNVAINIKPGTNPNSINLCTQGSTPVTIFGSEELDVALIDTGSLRFASADVKTVGKADRTLCSIEDAGAWDTAFFDSLDPTPDGFDDLTCHYVTDEITDLDDISAMADIMGAGCNDPSNGCLSGSPGFFEFKGTDSVRIVKDCP